MEKVEKAPNDPESEETEAIELILYQVSECYVYLIPPRKSAASYRVHQSNKDVEAQRAFVIGIVDKRFFPSFANQEIDRRTTRHLKIPEVILYFFFTICLGIIGLENYIQLTSLISKRNLKSKFTFLNTTCYEIQSLHTPSLFFFSAIKCSQAYNAIEYLNLWTILLLKRVFTYWIWIFISLEGYFRADEWDVNKWAWEGTLKVISKGEECIIRLEDKTTGELYARAFLRKGEQHPVEPVIDSSRYFVLRIEENIGGRLRHAFIGIGFRERTEAYDFQAALHDHMKYLDKKKTAEEMEQHFQETSSVDYSLKEGETLVLQMKNKPRGSVKSKFFEQGLNNLSLEGKSDGKEPLLSIRPPPPPPAPPSPATSVQISPSNLPPKISLDGNSTEKSPNLAKDEAEHTHFPDNESSQDIQDDDFGDFQAAG